MILWYTSSTKHWKVHPLSFPRTFVYSIESYFTHKRVFWVWSIVTTKAVNSYIWWRVYLDFELKTKVRTCCVLHGQNSHFCSTSHDGCEKREPLNPRCQDLAVRFLSVSLCPVLCQQRCLFCEFWDLKGPGGKALTSVTVMWEQAGEIGLSPAQGCETVTV